jgi:hypothetical protein
MSNDFYRQDAYEFNKYHRAEIARQREQDRMAESIRRQRTSMFRQIIQTVTMAIRTTRRAGDRSLATQGRRATMRSLRSNTAR